MANYTFLPQIKAEDNHYPPKMYLFKVNNFVNVVLVFLLFTLNIIHTFFWRFFVDFETVNVTWKYRLTTIILSFSKVLVLQTNFLRKSY